MGTLREVLARASEEKPANAAVPKADDHVVIMDADDRGKENVRLLNGAAS